MQSKFWRFLVAILVVIILLDPSIQQIKQATKSAKNHVYSFFGIHRAEAETDDTDNQATDSTKIYDEDDALADSILIMQSIDSLQKMPIK